MALKKKYLFGAAAVALIGLSALILLLFNGPHMEDQASFRTFEFEKVLPPEDAVAMGQDDFNPAGIVLPELNANNLKAGKVYYDYYCVHCHGYDGKGNGPVGKSYVPKPANINHKTYGSISSFYNAILTGTGHSPVLERVVEKDHLPYIMLYIQNKFK